MVLGWFLYFFFSFSANGVSFHTIDDGISGFIALLRFLQTPPKKKRFPSLCFDNNVRCFLRLQNVSLFVGGLLRKIVGWWEPRGFIDGPQRGAGSNFVLLVICPLPFFIWHVASAPVKCDSLLEAAALAS
mmetsp:Transcript_18530/g.38287  ORF Transcript_18530/g.38287 Transcript_18530/m.38287 type:complete len:130 (-) Transcript_18530:34-423(-)